MIQLETIAILGIEAIAVLVQVEIVKTIPSFVIVGMANRAITESKERIRGAFHSSNIGFPNGKIIVNLSPADIIKEGSHYDLAIAVGILKAIGKINFDLNDVIIFGELSLNGEIIKTKGFLPVILYCYQNDKSIIIHSSHYDEAASILMDKSHLIIVADSLNDILKLNKNTLKSNYYLYNIKNILPINSENNHSIDVYRNIIGHAIPKRACSLAMAGRHNILMFGPPGTGKSLLAKSLRNFNIEMDRKQSLIVSSIYSTAGLLEENNLIKYETFRTPHHSISYAGLLGGGTNFRPGEVSLSHNGILFLDEVAEFSQSNLDMLRQIMEDKKVSIARANYTINLPADFQFIATMNPCKCGYFGDAIRKCICGYMNVQKYQRRISGPLLDRIDLQVLVGTTNAMESTPDSSFFYNRVLKAREIQKQRYKKLREEKICNNILYNSHIQDFHIPHLKYNNDVLELINKFTQEKFLSHRKMLKILSLARTIADFELSDTVEKSHGLEAIFFNHKMTLSTNLY